MGPKIASSLLVAGLAVALYANSIPGEFVFDDHEAIENNLDVRSGVQHIIVHAQGFQECGKCIAKVVSAFHYVSLLSEQLCIYFSCAFTFICCQIMIHWFSFLPFLSWLELTPLSPLSSPTTSGGFLSLTQNPTNLTGPSPFSASD